MMTFLGKVGALSAELP